MNILLINHYAGSPYHGMEYRPYYLAKEWSQKGHSVLIVAASYSHIRTQQPKLNQTFIKNDIIDGVNYRWYKTSEYSGNGIGRAKNIFNFLRALWKDSKNIINDFKPDVVIASSAYPVDIWLAKRIAKRANAKLVYEVHDLWPLSPIELGGMSRWHPFIIWCQLGENYAYRHADKVVSMLPKTLSHMVSHGMESNKFNYVPNGIAIEEWTSNEDLPKEIISEVRRVKQRGLPIVAYAGTHGLANALDVLLDAAKLGKDKFEVILVGPGPDWLNLLKRVEAEEILNVTMLPAIPKNSIPLFLNEIDIAYIGLLPQPLFRFGISPNKLMDYMYAAKPIIMAIDAGNDPVTEVGCGVSVQPGDSNAIYDAMVTLINLTPEVRRKMGNKGKQFILSEQTYSVLAQRFINILEN